MSQIKQVSEYTAVQDLFDEIAEQFSSLPAIEAGTKRITYGELQADVDRLAGILSSAGVVEGSFVGIFLSDSIGIITSLLATLKAGGVFCPLDPSFPEKRLQVMFETVTPKLCITNSQFVEKLQRVVAGLPSAPEIIRIDDLPAPAAS